jgi:hypothetical protein
MWLVKAVGAMMYIPSADVEIGNGADSGDDTKFYKDYYYYCCFVDEL